MRLRERLGELEAAGGALAAISVDAPDDSAALMRRLEHEGDGGPLGFPLLSDASRATVKAYGVHHVERDIAIPAVLIVGRDGTIAWKRVGDSMMDRPPEDDVIRALEALKAAPPAGKSPRR